jgi:hypothetical protein
LFDAAQAPTKVGIVKEKPAPTKHSSISPSPAREKPKIVAAEEEDEEPGDSGWGKFKWKLFGDCCRLI